MLYYRKTKKKSKTDLKKLEDKLWDIFSLYIRLRDSDKDGICKCFTCNHRAHYTKMDCGHGIPRQHKATKFSEMNNHAQCKRCNGFEGGRREVYKEQMNKVYGHQTWDKMEIASKQTVHTSIALLQNNIDYYTQRVNELKEAKGMIHKI
jgi:hypothetical protein